MSQFPLEPYAVILWLTPQQAMVMSECCGLINWAVTPQNLFGRPGCAAVPLAMASGRPSQSLGCVGMRINTDVPQDRLLMVAPGGMLANMDADLFFTTEVHQRMRSHYLRRAADLSPAR